MRRIALAVAAIALSGCESGLYGDGYGYGGGGPPPPPAWRTYDYNAPGPDGRYDARDYYREGRYRERRLSRNDRLYRGSDGRYYCRRPDGSTGLVVGALAGGILGNIIAPGGSETLGTILGAGAGAAIGREVDRGQARCQ
jgi:hypothetical protein